MTTTRLCVTLTAETTAELRRKRDEVAGADLVELRLDTVSDPDAAGALAGRKLPVIVTCRPTWEGGQFKGSEDERRQILQEALARGAEYVDIEWKANFTDLISSTSGRRIVLSSHDFSGVPADLTTRAHAMRATGAEVVKLAVKTSRLSDCLPLLDLGAQIARQGTILIGMGECGMATRVLARKFGALWTYAGDLQHVGQVTASDLLDTYRFRSITESTDIYGLVGSPISHSVSPAMHNAAFAAARVDAVYLPLRAADAEDFVTFGRAMGLKGASVTIPFKVSLFDEMDEVYSVARRIGAINTMRAEGGRWIGGNTDASGFLGPLRDRVDLNGARVAVIGAGGSARAVAKVALSSRPGERHDLRAEPGKGTGRRDDSPGVAKCRAAAGARQLGRARQLHARGHVSTRRRHADRRGAAHRPSRVRPHLQPDADAVDARSGQGRMSGHRRPGNAGGPGARAV